MATNNRFQVGDVHSNFNIQSRPTQYLYFLAESGELICVSSTGLAVESDPDDMQDMRTADFPALMDNAQFVAALAVARSYADKRGLSLVEEVVCFD